MTEAKTVTLTLNEELYKFVRAEVEDGSFASISEYVNSVLREEQELVRQGDKMAQQSAAQQAGA
ncbi:hypothetical protein KX729_20220 [Rhizobium sp. XQZ8]|uniref:ribbon-helix-helix domain-containing protein n=1 Tax=Rhizobium populisoli TaxID=2859785 RepID=UPI001CA53CCF|nr:hypothetical protein [Rhizobium populisoli]MBW6423790.1 hypothetical protein [Rhizobium populisoli]